MAEWRAATSMEGFLWKWKTPKKKCILFGGTMINWKLSNGFRAATFSMIFRQSHFKCAGSEWCWRLRWIDEPSWEMDTYKQVFREMMRNQTNAYKCTIHLGALCKLSSKTYQWKHMFLSNEEGCISCISLSSYPHTITIKSPLKPYKIPMTSP